jgi:hypothetical protein
MALGLHPSDFIPRTAARTRRTHAVWQRERGNGNGYQDPQQEQGTRMNRGTHTHPELC